MDWFLTLPKPLVLASNSPRRARIFEQIGLEFEVIPSDIPEVIPQGHAPEAAVIGLARQKANQVAQNVKNRIVVGADTIVVLNSKILGKPSSLSEAQAMLCSLSGQTHTVYTGIAIMDADSLEIATDCESTRVTFRELNGSEIDLYLNLDNPIDKAGAYGIQDRSALFVEGINGCYYNVVGMPLSCFYSKLKKFLKHYD